jgi:hypothetical protein
LICAWCNSASLNQIVAFELNKPKIYLSINYSKNYIKIVHAINEEQGYTIGTFFQCYALSKSIPIVTLFRGTSPPKPPTA